MLGISGSSIGKSLENDIKNFVQYSRERNNSVENLNIQEAQSLNGGNNMLNIVDESESQVDDDAGLTYNINIK